jgi:hypothetical protein
MEPTVKENSKIQVSEIHQEIPKPIPAAGAKRSGLRPGETLERSLFQILTELESPSKQTRGRALELLMIHFIRLMDLDFEAWLLRSTDSEGIEVEALANGRQMPFSRWLIQCRNTHQMDTGDIATAVGRSVPFKPTIILSVTNGYFTHQARHYASRTMQLTSLQVLLIDATDLRTIANDEMAIESMLNREMEQVSANKQLQVAPLCARHHRG